PNRLRSQPVKRTVRACLIALPLALLGLTSMADHAKAADFESGGNTWPDSRIGDWVEYAMQTGLGVRIEVTAIAENGNITFKQTTYNADGSVSGENSRTREPAACPVQVRVPANTEVAWDTAEYD